MNDAFNQPSDLGEPAGLGHDLGRLAGFGNAGFGNVGFGNVGLTGFGNVGLTGFGNAGFGNVGLTGFGNAGLGLGGHHRPRVEQWATLVDFVVNKQQVNSEENEDKVVGDGQTNHANRHQDLPMPAQEGNHCDHPEVAPETIPKGPDGQRKQSVINWSTWLRSAIPSLTTRLASRTMAKYTRLVT